VGATREVLLRQFETAWKLAAYHLEGLTTEEALWRPAAVGLHVHRGEDGLWRADWPEHEGYAIGPPSIAWLTWHIQYWWAMAIDHAFRDAKLVRHDVFWLGTAIDTLDCIRRLRDEWLTQLGELPEEEWLAHSRTRWPFRDRPFADVVAWVNVELAKNATEIGYARFLYAARGGS
jgi:hypothetical protein